MISSTGRSSRCVSALWHAVLLDGSYPSAIGVVGIAWLAAECVIRLNWTFPEFSYPKFTTRHVLDLSDASGDVSFSGGPGSSYKTLEATRIFLSPSHPAEGDEQLPMLDPTDLCSPPKLTRSVPITNRLDQNPEDDFSTAPVPESSRPEDDELSVCSELTAATISTADGSCPCLNQTGTRDHCSCLVCPSQESADRILDQQQLQMLAGQRRDAEAMFTRTGDASGLLRVLESASQFRGSWEPFGMPRF